MEKTGTPHTSREFGRVPVGLTGETFAPGIHLCCIYSDEAERNRIIFRFLESGIRNGEKAACFMDAAPIADWEGYRRALGLNNLSPGQEGRLSLAAAEDIYYPGGTFDPDEMLERLATFYEQSVNEGYTGARAIGEASWIARGVSGASRFMEYEARVNDILPKYPLNVICLYNAGLFDRAMLRDALAVHPMIIIHGEIVKNPYYVKSWWLLKKCLGSDGGSNM
jgi:hypothetical protein